MTSSLPSGWRSSPAGQGARHPPGSAAAGAGGASLGPDGRQGRSENGAGLCPGAGPVGSIRLSRASSTLLKVSGSRPAVVNSSRPRVMTSADACESSAVRPSRGGRRPATRVARSSIGPFPSLTQVCRSASSWRTASNSSRVRSVEVPVASCTRQLRSLIAKPPEPAPGGIGKHIGSPADREGNDRRTGRSPEQPHKHTKKVPSSLTCTAKRLILNSR